MEKISIEHTSVGLALIYGFSEKIWTIVVFVNRSHTHVLQDTTLLSHCLIWLRC